MEIDEVIEQLQELRRTRGGKINVCVDGFPLSKIEVEEAEEGFPAYIDLTGR